MARIVGLWPAGSAIRVGREEAERLAAFGVSRATLLTGGETMGVVLEGWAFDPVRSGEDALAVLCPDPRATPLLPSVEVGVTISAQEGTSP